MEDLEILKSLSIADFIKLMKLALWTVQGEELGVSLTYHDNELMVFRKEASNGGSTFSNDMGS